MAFTKEAELFVVELLELQLSNHLKKNLEETLTSSVAPSEPKIVFKGLPQFQLETS